jgi:excisionase family DNA binding protein
MKVKRKRFDRATKLVATNSDLMGTRNEIHAEQNPALAPTSLKLLGETEKVTQLVPLAEHASLCHSLTTVTRGIDRPGTSVCMRAENGRRNRARIAVTTATKHAAIRGLGRYALTLTLMCQRQPPEHDRAPCALRSGMSDAQQLRLVPDLDTECAKSRHPSARGRHEQPPLESYGDVMTVEEAANVLRISRSSAYELTRVWRATHRSGLPVLELGRRLAVPKSALEELLARPGRLYLAPATTDVE